MWVTPTRCRLRPARSKPLADRRRVRWRRTRPACAGRVFAAFGDAEQQRRELARSCRSRIRRSTSIVTGREAKRSQSAARIAARRSFLLSETTYERGLRPEDDAAVAPLRRADRALASAAGALLLPRLLAAAADLVAASASTRFRRAGSPARGRRRGTSRCACRRRSSANAGRDRLVAQGRALRIDDCWHYFAPAAVARAWAA